MYISHRYTNSHFVKECFVYNLMRRYVFFLVMSKNNYLFIYGVRVAMWVDSAHLGSVCTWSA